MQNQLKGRDRSNGEIRNSLKNRIFMNFNTILASFCFVEVDVSANTENCCWQNVSIVCVCASVNNAPPNPVQDRH